MVRLCWVLVSVFAFLSHVTTPYQVGTGCNAAELQVLVDDAMNLVDRAAWVLNDYLLPGQPPNPLRDGAVKNILVAFIGVTAANDVQNARTIQNRFREMVTGVGGRGTGTANLKIHCRDPAFDYVYTPPQPPPSRPPPVTRFHAFPVELTRLGGQQPLDAPLEYFSLIGGSLMHLFPMEPAGECMGYTFKVAPDDHEMETQQRHTGSSTVWSDIVLKVAMQNNPQKVNRLSEVNDWRPDQLHPVNLWHIGGAQVVTLIHELMHSTVLTRPVTIHGMVGDAMANDLGQIMNLANTNGEGVVDNPETYGYLALALSMPWLKWWNNDVQNRNGPPINDDLVYAPQYNFQISLFGTEYLYMPTFGSQAPPNADFDWWQQQLRRGPRAFL